MKLGIIIPTFQEEKNIKGTLEQAIDKLLEQDIPYEIIIVDDNSNDETNNIVNSFIKKNKNIKFYLNDKKKGFGNSIVMGINKCSSDFLTILMADKSDSIDDLIKYYNIIKDDNDLDCVFGDRWSKNSPKNYPLVKKIFNRMGNKIVGILFRINYYDFTNSFKMYKRSSLIKIYPILSNHFSITVELPLKMITRGFNYKIIDNSWENREHGVSKMKLIDSIITYLIIVAYCLIDKYFWNKRYDSSK